MDNTSLFFLIFNLSRHNAFLDMLMLFGARYLIFGVFLLNLFFLFKGTIKERKAFFLMILSFPIAVLIIIGIHFFFYEPRPFVTFHLTPLYPYNPDASFPSRHASFISIIAFAYLYFKSKWSPLFILFLIWIGISRVFVGVHYPIDILGGFIIGIISLFFSIQIIKLLRRNLFG